MSRPFRTVSFSIAIGLVLSLTLAACHKKPPVVPPPAPPPPAPVVAAPPPPPPPAPPPAPTPAPPRVPTAQEQFDAITLTQLNAQKPLEDVYFEYDKSDLSEAARASLAKNATWLKGPVQGKVTVSVEGHTDSRGTSEYNLALGERRASAVRDYLGTLGIPAGRVSIVSMGEEQPMCREETEACWTQNRRGHFVILTK